MANSPLWANIYNSFTVEFGKVTVTGKETILAQARQSQGLTSLVNVGQTKVKSVTA